MQILRLPRAFLVLLLTATGLWTISCDLDRKGMVLLLDTSYHASVLATERDGFAVPDGILWQHGRLYMADEGGSSLRIWDGPGTMATLCDRTSGIRSPEDLVVDLQGNVFFTDDDAGGVWKMDKAGKVAQLVSKEQGLTSTEGIVFDGAGNLLVGEGESHQVFSITPNGEVSVFLGPEYGIAKPESMVFDDQENLYIADNDEKILYMLTPQKVLHRIIKDREGFSPETLWFSEGTLYITDSEHGKLFRYTPSNGLEPVAVFGGKLSKVHGVTSDESGALYLSVQTDLRTKQGYILKLERRK